VTVNHIMGNLSDKFNVVLADINDDGAVYVADVEFQLQGIIIINDLKI